MQKEGADYARRGKKYVNGVKKVVKREKKCLTKKRGICYYDSRADRNGLF